VQIGACRTWLVRFHIPWLRQARSGTGALF
jgi:hypothetical protein